MICQTLALHGALENALTVIVAYPRNRKLTSAASGFTAAR